MYDKCIYVCLCIYIYAYSWYRHNSCCRRRIHRRRHWSCCYRLRHRNLCVHACVCTVFVCIVTDVSVLKAVNRPKSTCMCRKSLFVGDVHIVRTALLRNGDLCVHIFIFIHDIHIYMYVHIYVYVNMYIYIYIYIYAFIYTCVCVYIYVCIYVYHIDIYVYIPLCICIYTRTYKVFGSNFC